VNRYARWAVRTANRVTTRPTGLSTSLRHLVPGRAEEAQLRDAIGGKTILVTGASSGIGEATARLAGEAGAHVLLVARRFEELERVKSEIEAAGGRADAYVCDLSDFDALDATAEKILAEHGQIDVLVNNAGMSIRRRLDRSTDRFHDFERQMRLNYFAAIRLIMAVLPGMRARHGGHVVTISTWAVQVRPARFSGYAASKAALEAWLDCVQAEVAEDGVDFTTIRMPLVRTPMITPTKAYRGAPALTPREAAEVVGEAMVHRPRRLRPPISQMLAFSDALSPRSVDRIRRRYG
jgi:NAD(P)-dependent dehydrogenase (short-subunit alcohol dehydrogenase family)